MAWFLGPAEYKEPYFQRLRRLNQGLNTSQWRVYERKEEPKTARLVLSIDSSSIAALEVVRRFLLSGVEQAIFSLLGVKPEVRVTTEVVTCGREERAINFFPI